MGFFPSVTFKQALCGLENVVRASIYTRVVNKQVKCQFWVSYPFKMQPEPAGLAEDKKKMEKEKY